MLTFYSNPARGRDRVPIGITEGVDSCVQSEIKFIVKKNSEIKCRPIERDKQKLNYTGIITSVTPTREKTKRKNASHLFFRKVITTL